MSPKRKSRRSHDKEKCTINKHRKQHDRIFNYAVELSMDIKWNIRHVVTIIAKANLVAK